MKEMSPEEFEEARQKFNEAVEKGEQVVEYTSLDKKKIENHSEGADFRGNLVEFDQLYEWKWVDENTKILIEKSNQSPFSGLIHIQDPLLNEDTYPNSEQKIKFSEGVIKFIDSREI